MKLLAASLLFFSLCSCEEPNRPTAHQTVATDPSPEARAPISARNEVDHAAAIYLAATQQDVRLADSAGTPSSEVSKQASRNLIALAENTGYQKLIFHLRVKAGLLRGDIASFQKEIEIRKAARSQMEKAKITHLSDIPDSEVERQLDAKTKEFEALTTMTWEDLKARHDEFSEMPKP